MSDRIRLLIYLFAVIVATLVHRPWPLAAGLGATLLLAGREAPAIFKRALKTALPFSLTVTAAYAVAAVWQDSPWRHFVLLLNLRVLLMTTMAYLCVSRIDFTRALSFSRTLSFVLTLTISQILTFRRLHDDFRLALRSRTLRRTSRLTALRHGAAAGAWFLHKAEHDAAEMTQALTSRGFFIDRG